MYKVKMLFITLCPTESFYVYIRSVLHLLFCYFLFVQLDTKPL